MFEGIEISTVLRFNAGSFQGFKDGRAQTESLKGGALAMSEQFQKSDGRAQAGSAEVKRQVAHVAIPYRDRCSTNQYPGIVRKW